MTTTDTNEIRHKMNIYGREGKPFFFAINFEQTEGLFIDKPLLQTDVLFQFCGKGNAPEQEVIKKVSSFNYIPIPYSEYKKKFDIVHKGLKEGYSYLTNLTIKTPVSFNLTLEDIFFQSNASYKVLYSNKFVCFSPERFVKIAGKIISTNPMKGTIDANIPDAEQIILNDYKETAEHNTIVDLLRNDLSIIADNVRVNRFRYIDRIRTNKNDILQVSSEITGTLREENYLNYGDIIFGMLPAGSISGAPKEATRKIIQEAESEPRGYYTGVCGYYDGNELDSAVIIRYIENDENQYYFRSGGGITAYSDCEEEYKEVLEKIYLPIV
ncbi:MAG: aminodeoxychorismate synthase component I [Dysgonomonas mossii]|uniref:aminodeoxychorismate synthase component I n=1 Tax=Dysgonomonas mossii TaxID=163665 RepID=UPI001D6EF640|nr:aminodeoxychorismate synthase component I [Dysgonomonas mossii]MBS5796089.1 aminodeoxychorismate synthase component I [Dysgonomonas mossii]MBS7110991.1 aminodeoxychorismate synthase component I [Dysgonomonas mossii]